MRNFLTATNLMVGMMLAVQIPQHTDILPIMLTAFLSTMNLWCVVNDIQRIVRREVNE